MRVSAKGKADHDDANSPESEYIGQKITESAALILVKKANPATYISTEDPPFLIEHGTEDNLVPIEQSIDFQNELLKVLPKEKVSFKALNGSKHGGPAFETPENLKFVFEFLDNNLK
jgi:dipeptidyl aminopeptidase/acylaminoacyl peptidase